MIINWYQNLYNKNVIIIKNTNKMFKLFNNKKYKINNTKCSYNELKKKKYKVNDICPCLYQICLPRLNHH